MSSSSHPLSAPRYTWAHLHIQSPWDIPHPVTPRSNGKCFFAPPPLGNVDIAALRRVYKLSFLILSPYHEVLQYSSTSEHSSALPKLSLLGLLIDPSRCKLNPVPLVAKAHHLHAPS